MLQTERGQLFQTQQAGAPQVGHWVRSLEPDIDPLLREARVTGLAWHEHIPYLFQHDRVALLFVPEGGLVNVRLLKKLKVL